MAIVGTRITLGTTPEPIVPLSTGLPMRSGADPWPALVILLSGGAVDVGGAGVASGAGFPLATNVPFSFDVDFDDVLYGVSASSSVIAVLIGRQ